MDILPIIIALLSGGGVVGGIVALWNLIARRRQPGVEIQKIEVETQKIAAETDVLKENAPKVAVDSLKTFSDVVASLIEQVATQSKHIELTEKQKVDAKQHLEKCEEDLRRVLSNQGRIREEIKDIYARLNLVEKTVSDPVMSDMKGDV